MPELNGNYESFLHHNLPHKSFILIHCFCNYELGKAFISILFILHQVLDVTNSISLVVFLYILDIITYSDEPDLQNWQEIEFAV